jgi:HEAT repeat protein
MVLDTIAHALSYDPNPEVRAKAAESLGKLGDQSATPLLLAALADPNPAIQCSAIQALGRLGDEAAVPRLLQVLEGGSTITCQAAAAALGHIGSRRSSVIYSGALERQGRRYHAEHGDDAARGSDY